MFVKELQAMIQPDQENRTKSDLAETIRIAARQWISLGSQSYQLFMHKDMDVFSGNATFYILMAMVPFFTLAVGLINFLPENFLIGFGDMLVSLFPNIPQIQSMMQELVNQVNPQKGTLVVSISLLIMIWSASNGVSALQLGLMRISENKQAVIHQRLSAMVYTILFIALIPVMLIFRVFRSSISEIGVSIASLFHRPEISELFNNVLKDGGLIASAAMGVVVLLTYSFLQGHLRPIQKQLPGAVFTTILWILFSELYEWFISTFWNASALYGSMASVFLIAMWLKTIITILFLGASLNEVLYQNSQSSQIQKKEQPFEPDI